jgi:hypothetical protein
MSNKTFIFLFWGCYLCIAVPMAIMYGLESTKTMTIIFASVFVFVLILGWFLKKIGWK